MSKPRMYRISTAAMQSSIAKLNLSPGDVLVCRDAETLHYLSHCGLKLDFNVPLVFSPAGVTKLTRSDLLNLLEQLDQASEPMSVAIPESASVPL